MAMGFGLGVSLPSLEELVPTPFLRKTLELAIVIAAGWLICAGLMFVVRRVRTRAESRVAEGPARDRTAAFFGVIEAAIKAAIVFAAASRGLVILGIQALVVFQALTIIVSAWFVYVVLARVVKAAAESASARIEHKERQQQVRTFILLGESIVKYLIIFVAGLSLLGQFDVDLRPVLAGAGVLGLAVGFGAQNLVRDVISGFFIMLEGQYSIGDQVEIDGVFGTVEGMGLRTTKLREPSGKLRHFPNGSISSANNYTEDQVAYVAAVPVPREDPGDPVPIVQRILDDFDGEFKVFAQPPTLRVDDLPSYSRVVRVEMRAIPGRHSLVEQKLAARVGAGLKRAGYALPSGTDVAVTLRYPPLGTAG